MISGRIILVFVSIIAPLRRWQSILQMNTWTKYNCSCVWRSTRSRTTVLYYHTWRPHSHVSPTCRTGPPPPNGLTFQPAVGQQSEVVLFLLLVHAKGWNGLPSDVTSASSLALFKNRLKTYLFRCSYENVWLWMTLSSPSHYIPPVQWYLQ